MVDRLGEAVDGCLEVVGQAQTGRGGEGHDGQAVLLAEPTEPSW